MRGTVERRWHDNRGAEEWGLGRGLFFPSRLEGLGSVESSPEGSGAELRPPTILVHIMGLKTTLVALKIPYSMVVFLLDEAAV